MVFVAMTLVAILAFGFFCIITRPDTSDDEYRALADRPEFASLCRVTIESDASGSGVLVAPRWVLTAAHVVHDKDPTNVFVEIGAERIPVRRIVVYDGYASAPAGFERTALDHALIELSRDAAARPARLARDLPAPGTLATIAGFGVGGPGARDVAGIRRAAKNRLDQIGGMWRSIRLAAHLILLDFDVPGRSDRNVLGMPEPEPLEGMASGGDSGGPVFVGTGQDVELVATFSVSSVDVGAAIDRSFAGGINVLVGIAPHRAWIDRVIAGVAGGRH